MLVAFKLHSRKIPETTGLSVSFQCPVKIGNIGKYYSGRYIKTPEEQCSHQHGFMKGKSCLLNLISFYDKVIHLADQGKQVDVIYLEFSKAFDIVSKVSFWPKCPGHSWINMSWDGWATGPQAGHNGLQWMGWDIRLATCHQWGSIELHPWPCALQHLINNQDTGLERILIKFADYTKLEGAVNSRGQRGPAERTQQMREMGNHQLYQV